MLNSKALNVQSLHSGYFTSKFSLKDISFNAPCGQITGILGANGSGKSTLLLTIAGLIKATTGKIFWEDKKVQSLPAHKRARLFSTMLQKTNIAQGYTALEFVLQGRFCESHFLLGYSKLDEQLASAALGMTKTLDFVNRQLSELSGGELQRVVLARALAQNNQVLLLDEPTSSLDPGQGANIMLLLQELARAKNLAVVTVLHDLNLAALFCDQLIFLKEGKLLKQGKSAEVFTKEVLKETYGENFILIEHPQGGKQVLYPKTLPL